MNKSFGVVAGLVAASAAFSISQPATAQESTTAFQVEHFEPLPSQKTNLLNLGKSRVLPHLTPSAGLVIHFVDDPIQVEQDDAVQNRLIDDQLKAELSAGLGLFDWVDLGFVLPVVLYQSAGDLSAFGNAGDISAVSIADLRIVPKVKFIDPSWAGGFGAALLVPIYLPIGDTDSFNGDGAVRAEPRLALDWFHDSGFGLMANVAYQLRQEKVAQNYVSGDVLRWGVGLEAPLGMDELRGMATLFGHYSLEDGRDPTNPSQVADNTSGQPMEAQLGLRIDLPANLLAQVGGGFGLTEGVGSPDFRILAGLTWAPMGGDRDEDGILDADDACPDDPEDIDEFEDKDGCPDTDNDEDGILDVSDQCPMDPEDVDGFEDDNGCPDPDNDNDGVLDVDDKCPMDPGPADNGGCPLVDSDGDGLMDNADKCPNDPEDKDGFQDEDGCPDPDNDNDGILDPDDKCPLEPETINGNKDDDGCPDEGASKVRVTKTKIEILEKVFFDSNKDTIKERSHDILNQVAAVLKAHKQITRIRIEGHTDSRGKDEYNLDLSKRRAAAVRTYLIGRGVEENRMESEGYGETKPIDTNDTKAGRAVNRRVEFNILEVDGKPIGDSPAVIETPAE